MADSRVTKLTWRNKEAFSDSSRTIVLVINNSILFGSEYENKEAFGRKPYLISKEYVTQGEPYDYLAMMETKFDLGVNNTWVNIRKPYKYKSYSTMLTGYGTTKEYLPTTVTLKENSIDASGVSIEDIESRGAITTVKLKALPSATGSYNLYAEDTLGNIISDRVYTAVGGRIFTASLVTGTRHELIKYPKVFVGGSDVTGRHYLWKSVLIDTTTWSDGGIDYTQTTRKAQYSTNMGVTWNDYGDNAIQLLAEEPGGDPYAAITGNNFYGGDEDGVVTLYSISSEVFTTTPENDHLDNTGITEYYGNLDDGVFTEASAWVYHWDRATGEDSDDRAEEYYYYNPGNYVQCYLSYVNSTPPFTYYFEGMENNISFSKTIDNNTARAHITYYSNRS